MNRAGGLALAASALTITACVTQPDIYAPPMQRHAYSGPDTSNLKHFVAMNDPNVMAHVLRDVSGYLDSNTWRWTNQRPLFRFVLPTTKNLRLIWDFGIPVDTFRHTGPVTATFTVNGRQLGTLRCSAPGQHTFEKAVPSEWLRTGEDTIVGAEFDKVYIAEEDKAKLGVALHKVGFRD